MSNSVIDRVNHEKCCGCLACMDACPTGAITVGKDEFGFRYPTIDNGKCIACGKCAASCPTLHAPAANTPVSAWAAVHKNDGVVFESSSGGIFTALAEEVLDQGGVVCGAAMDSEYNVRHVIVFDRGELPALRKSKYVQSDLKGIFSEIKKLLRTRLVLFSGTPCQVAALKAFLGGDDEKLLTVDVVCHGVPNNDLFHDYIRFLEASGKKLTEYEFRAKRQARNGMNWYSALHLEGGRRKVFNWPTDSYNFFYMKRKIYRDSCYECDFARQERASDMTLCDYWGWEEFHRTQFPKNSSVSGVILNSEKGNAIFKRIAPKLLSFETSYQNISLHNKSLSGTAAKPTDRDDLLREWKEKGYQALDAQFRSANRVQILKYKLIDMIQEKLKLIVR